MKMKGNANRSQLAYGTFGIKAIEGAWITARQIEAARIAATRYMKREGQLWIKIFPDKPITKKPAEVRMGKGKGAVEYWVAVVKPGKSNVRNRRCTLRIAKEALKTCSSETSCSY
jgi:large subunit ribosomal protein L16